MEVSASKTLSRTQVNAFLPLSLCRDASEFFQMLPFVTVLDEKTGWQIGAPTVTCSTQCHQNLSSSITYTLSYTPSFHVQQTTLTNFKKPSAGHGNAVTKHSLASKGNQNYHFWANPHVGTFLSVLHTVSGQPWERIGCLRGRGQYLRRCSAASKEGHFNILISRTVFTTCSCGAKEAHSPVHTEPIVGKTELS